MPDLTLQRKREWLVEEIEGIDTKFLWEKTPRAFGTDWSVVKTGDINTILAELARRMRDGAPS